MTATLKRAWPFLLFVQIFFGLNYVFSKEVMLYIPALVWSSFRACVTAGILLAIGLVFFRKTLPKTRDFYYPLIGYSLLGVVINQVLFLLGLSMTTATNSSVLSTSIPIFTLLFAGILHHETINAKRAMGFILAFIGVLVLRKFENYRFSDHTFLGDCLVILNSMSYALYLSLARNFIIEYDRFWITTWLFIYGAVVITLLALPQWIHFEWPEVLPMKTWFSLGYAVICGTLLAYLFNVLALGRTKSSNVALWIYAQPILAAGFAYYWFGEKFTLRTLVSVFLIFLGMLVAMRFDRHRPLA